MPSIFKYISYKSIRFPHLFYKYFALLLIFQSLIEILNHSITSYENNDFDGPVPAAIRIVDENRTFDAEKFLKSVENVSGNVHVVSIIGKESSGKSTLLNILFGTNFRLISNIEVMNRTSGISFSLARRVSQFSASNDSVFVFDVDESSYGNNTGIPFEHQAALFSLSTSDVLLINTMENDLANIKNTPLPMFEAILKTALELDMLKRPRNGTLTKYTRKKVRLLFVIRDYSTKTPLKVLEGSIMEYMKFVLDKAKEILKTESQMKSLEELFHIQFYPIKSLISYPYNNATKVVNNHLVYPLRSWFYDSESKDFLFSKRSYKTAETVVNLCEEVWKLIRNNETMDKLKIIEEKCNKEGAEGEKMLNKIEDELKEEIKKGDKIGGNCTNLVTKNFAPMVNWLNNFVGMAVEFGTAACWKAYETLDLVVGEKKVELKKLCK